MKKNLHLQAQTASPSEKIFPLPLPIKWDGIRTDMDALDYVEIKLLSPPGVKQLFLDV
jgi:hypothetical protein